MPGAFHTELTQRGASGITVYLLDFKFKDPSVSNSSVNAILVRGSSEIRFKCSPVKKRFECSLPAGEKLTAGDQIKVLASRRGSPGAPVIYSFPFTREGVPAMPSTGHGNH